MALAGAVQQAGTFARTVTASPQWVDFLRGVFTEQEQIEIVSIRSFARPGPRRMTEFGTVVQLLQLLPAADDASGYLAAGAATLLFDSEGRLTAGACRNKGDETLHTQARRFSDSADGQMAWTRDAAGRRRLAPGYMAKLCS
jgi:hypothetical protein